MESRTAVTGHGKAPSPMSSLDVTKVIEPRRKNAYNLPKCHR